MSLHYIIDGYNIIKHPAFASKIKTLSDVRNALIRFIEENKLCGSLKNKVTVVFDGLPHLLFNRKPGSYEVIFTKGETADDKIKRLVNDSANPKAVVVVSDDREIAFFIRSLGAKPLGVEEFLKKGSVGKIPKAEPPKPQLSYTAAEKINEELRRLWLK